MPVTGENDAARTNPAPTGAAESPSAAAQQHGLHQAAEAAGGMAAPTYSPVAVAAEQQPLGNPGHYMQPANAPVTTMIDPIDEAPAAVWYVRPPSGGQYGPAAGPTMRAWLNEGRVTANSLVWRDGWPEWRSAAATFPSLAAAQPGWTGAAPGGMMPGHAAVAPMNAAPMNAAPMNAAPLGG